MIKRSTIFVFFLLFLNTITAQEVVEWSKNYSLKLSDFQSKVTQVNDTLKMNSFGAGNGIEFFYQMSNYEFMFTKNFNAKVTTTFNQAASYIITPDSAVAEDLVLFGQYSFDLSELYARKLRKELYEKKKTFSNASFFKPIYEETLAKLNEENSNMFSKYNFGKNKAALVSAHEKVKKELLVLANFCKTCKSPKKK